MIPCKRPKVTVEWHPMAGRTADGSGTEGRHVVICHVPGCGSPRKYHVVKAGAQEEARVHRDAHRSAVPVIEVQHLGVYAVVRCACGHERRVHGTRRDLEAHVEYHLTTAHGLVA